MIECLKFWYEVVFENLAQIATILSPIIAVIIAIWASRSSAKETQNKIDKILQLSSLQIAMHILILEHMQVEAIFDKEDCEEEIKQLALDLNELNKIENKETCATEFDKIESKIKSLRKKHDQKNNYQLNMLLQIFSLMRAQRNLWINK